MLRVATEADLPAIVAIHKSNMPTRLATADLDPVSVESRTGWFAEHSPERRPLWVLDGAAGIERPAYGATAEVSVYVHADHKGRGNGRLLLATGIERAPGLGLETLLGFIFGHNRASLRLFEGLGFGRWGVLPRVAVLDGVERDLVIVGRRVAD